MLSVQCPHCEKKLKVKEELAGKKLKCPGCGGAVPVTAAAAKAPVAKTIAPAAAERTQAPTAKGKTPLPRDADGERTVPPRDRPVPTTVPVVDADDEDLPTVPPDDVSASGRSRTFSGKPSRPTDPKSLQQTQGAFAGEEQETQDGDEQDDEDKPWDFLAPPQKPDEIGRLGPYRVLKVLGAGGMGVVFKAEDPQLKRLVALKAMLPSMASSGSAKKRFLREAQAAAALKHDHIVAIHQVGEDRGAPYLAMEFLQGEPLDERLKREGKLPSADVLRIGREVAEGLAAAHEQNLIHRDIKPANVWLERRRASRAERPEPQKTGKLALDTGLSSLDSFRSKILDFGLARSMGDDTGLTQTGAIMGTPQYMAPEQAGGAKVDHRCDLFSLGVMLYRMCAGELPFNGKDTITILSALALETPKQPRELNPKIPAGLNDLIMHLLAKKPDERPQSAQEVVDALTALEAGEKPAVRKYVDKAKRKKLILAASVAVGVLVMGFVTYKAFFAPARVEGPPIDPKGGGETTRPPLVAIPAGEPLSPLALVAKPALIKGIQSWTIEPVTHRGDVNDVAFSPDGKWLASGGHDGHVRIWDTSTWQLNKMFVGEARINYLLWAMNSKFLALSAGQVDVWDIESGRKLVRIKDRGPLAWSDDMKTLAVGSVRLYEVQTGDQLDKAVLGDHFTFLPDGKTAAAVKDGKVRMYLAKSLNPLNDFDLPKGAQWAGWSPDRKKLAVRVDKSVFFLDASTGKVLGDELKLQIRPGFQVTPYWRWSPDGKVLLNRQHVSSRDGDFLIIDATAEKQENGLRFLPGEYLTVAWSPDSKILAAGAKESGSIYLFEAANLKTFAKKLQGHTSPGFSWLRWSTDGKQLSGSGLTCEIASGKIFELKKSMYGWSPDGKWTAFIEHGGLNIRDLSEKNVPIVKPMAYQSISSWSCDSNTIVTGEPDGKVTLWDPADGKERKSLKTGLPTSVVLSPNGKELAVRHASGITFVDPDSGKKTGSIPTPSDNGGIISYAPSGQAIASWDANGTLEVRSSDGKSEIWKRNVIYGGHGKYSSLAWSPDSKLLASGHATYNGIDEGFVRIWDGGTGKLNGIFLPLNDKRGLALSGDGHWRGTPERLQRDLVYVFQTDQGQQTLPPEEFEKRFGWKNDPDRVRLSP